MRKCLRCLDGAAKSLKVLSVRCLASSLPPLYLASLLSRPILRSKRFSPSPFPPPQLATSSLQVLIVFLQSRAWTQLFMAVFSFSSRSLMGSFWTRAAGKQRAQGIILEEPCFWCVGLFRQGIQSSEPGRSGHLRWQGGPRGEETRQCCVCELYSHRRDAVQEAKEQKQTLNSLWKVASKLNSTLSILAEEPCHPPFLFALLGLSFLALLVRAYNHH